MSAFAEVVQRMVTEAGQTAGLPPPYTVVAVYEDRFDPLVRFAVFTDGHGQQWQTGRFKLTREG